MLSGLGLPAALCGPLLSGLGEKRVVVASRWARGREAEERQRLSHQALLGPPIAAFQQGQAV